MNGATHRHNVRRVAVIGAGPIGISTAKHLVGEQCFDIIDVYEQQSDFGGAWIWSQPQHADELSVPQTSPLGPLDKVHTENQGKSSEIQPPVVMTPMYDTLESNIPHQLMMFSDKNLPNGVQLFPSRQRVLQYIQEYGADIKHLVHFGTQIIRLQLRQDQDGRDVWRLSAKNVISGVSSDVEYDAVALANGHYALPSLPKVAGMEAWHKSYPGSIVHSKWFRNADQFTNKKVVIVGNASSGIDIGSQISRKCKKPLVMSARSEPLFKLPDFAEHVDVPGLVEFLDPADQSRAVKFSDGTVIADVDVVLFCTGYFFNFPFLEDSLLSEITSTGYMVHGTYKHLFLRQHPTLSFMALPNKVLPMPMGDGQAAVVARVWSGRLKLPSKTEMKLWELERWRTQAELLQSRGKSVDTPSLEKAFHSMGYPQDLNYHNELVSWAALATKGHGKALPKTWGDRDHWLRSKMADLKKAFADLQDNKHSVTSLEQLGFDYEKHKAELEQQEQEAQNGTGDTKVGV